MQSLNTTEKMPFDLPGRKQLCCDKSTWKAETELGKGGVTVGGGGG